MIRDYLMGHSACMLVPCDGPVTVHLAEQIVSQLAESPDMGALSRYVVSLLRDRGAKGVGMVHEWHYSDGSVRYTFQPGS